MRLEWKVLLCNLFTNLSYLMLGYSLDFPSPIASEVKSADLLDDYQFGIFSSIFYLSAAIGSFTAILIMYCMGRKSVIITAAIISTVGWIILSISRVSYLLICGRVVTGLGSGLSVPIVSIYIGELANKNTRNLYTIDFIFSELELIQILCRVLINVLIKRVHNKRPLTV